MENIINETGRFFVAMKTSVIGYPRIGANRELKFASEKYFRQEISQRKN